MVMIVMTITWIARMVMAVIGLQSHCNDSDNDDNDDDNDDDDDDDEEEEAEAARLTCRR